MNRNRTKLIPWAVCISSLLAAETAFAGPDYFGLGNGQDGAQTITAANTIINAYTGIASATAAATTFTVDNGAVVSTGDLVMLWQTSGAANSPPNIGEQGPFDLSAVGAGHWEFARVTAVNSNTITVADGLLQSYTSTAQVVVVPEYTSLTVDAAGSITAKDWDGDTGGITIALVQGALDLQGDIDVTARGFRGGVRTNGSGDSGCTALTETTARGARRGESLAAGRFVAAEVGRGNHLSGGGGGVCHNSGGAGGGHGGQGGKGGRTWVGDPEANSNPTVGRDVGGFGGAQLTYDFKTYLTFGGGGGSGHANNNVNTGGGDGGGAIFVRAGSISGTGNLIADGGAAGVSVPGGTPAVAGNDAAGGAGAGGAIALFVEGSATCGSALARGGRGGDVVTGSAHGTGGGGAGGRVYLQYN
ncbi:MAG: cell envelope biogenesis protein OmpA, partial [Myxococcota bacterium]|nr:cell envelope biogenesis protein OmpA [Myxococcota bacterium]